MRARRTFGPRGIFANPIGLSLVVGLLAYGAIQSAMAPAPSSSVTALAGGATSFSGHVTRIVDGDTFWTSSKDVRIRVWASTLRSATRRKGRRRPLHCLG